MTPPRTPSVILLHSPRPDTDDAYRELERLLRPIVAPVPVVMVAAGEGFGMSALADAAFIGGGQPEAAAVLQAHGMIGGDWSWVHLTSSGPDVLAEWGPLPGDPLVTHSRGVNARTIAEWALGAILHFQRDFDRYLEQAAAPSDRWQRHWARELSGSGLLVVGAGAAGAETARLARAFGMTTVGVSRSGARAEAFDRIVPPDALDAALAAADVTLVLLPLTDETRGTFDAERIERLRRGSLLLVASRGGIVDEDAVLEAVRAGRLRGAAFDVFAEEPLPDASPLWSEPRILVTPHVAGTTDRFMRNTARILEEIWTAWQGGGDPAVLAHFQAR